MVGAAGLSDCLVAEADAKHRSRRAEMRNDILADSGIIRSSGARRYKYAIRPHGFDIAKGERVVSTDRDLGVVLPDEMHEVVRKGVVVVQNQYHDGMLVSSPVASRTFSMQASARVRAARAPWRSTSHT